MVKFKVPAWLLEERGLASAALEGEILRETAKAYYVRAHALVRESDRCHRCHQPIDNPASRILGYGPICASYLGLPHAEVYAAMTPEERKAVLEAASVRTEVTMWFPKSQIEATFEYPCRRKPRAEWCDWDGLGGFMGHTCLPKPAEAQVRVVRTIVYEGVPHWIERMLKHAMADGEHRWFGAEGSITITTTEAPEGLALGNDRRVRHEAGTLGKED